MVIRFDFFWMMLVLIYVLMVILMKIMFCRKFGMRCCFIIVVMIYLMGLVKSSLINRVSFRFKMFCLMEDLLMLVMVWYISNVRMVLSGLMMIFFYFNRVFICWVGCNWCRIGLIIVGLVMMRIVFNSREMWLLNFNIIVVLVMRIYVSFVVMVYSWKIGCLRLWILWSLSLSDFLKRIIVIERLILLNSSFFLKILLGVIYCLRVKLIMRRNSSVGRCNCYLSYWVLIVSISISVMYVVVFI